jgi:hypothetical protein
MEYHKKYWLRNTACTQNVKRLDPETITDSSMLLQTINGSDGFICAYSDPWLSIGTLRLFSYLKTRECEPKGC